MEKELKKKIYILAGIILFFLALVIILNKLPERKILRKRAAGGPVTLSLSPASGNILAAGTTINIVMVSSTAKNVRAGEIVLQLDANAVNLFNISGVECSGSFPSSAFRSVTGNRISLSCYRPGGTEPITLGATPTVFASFVLSPKATASPGTGIISFVSAIIPESETYVDLYGSGISGTYTLPGAVSPSPTATIEPTRPVTPTATPTPTGPTATPTLTLTPMPTPSGCGRSCDLQNLCPAGFVCKLLPTPGTTKGRCRNRDCQEEVTCVCPVTPTPAPCPGGHLGDINCDRTINLYDLNWLVSKWGTSGIFSDPNFHSADIVPDNKVNMADLVKLLDNWLLSFESIPTPTR